MEKMKFSGELSDSTKGRIDSCDLRLIDPERLKAIELTGLMDSPTEQAFDRLANLAARILKVPLTIVSIVTDKKQFFKAGHGLPAPFDTLREVPIDSSICRYTLAGEEIIADDSLTDPLLKFHPTTGPWGIGAFIAIPMIDPNGHVLGAFCAVDVEKRPWTEEDIEVMRELTASVMTEINLRRQIANLNDERKLRETFIAALTHDLRTPLTASKMSAQVLAKSSPDSPAVQKIVHRISENMDRADRMIQDLLDANQIKVGEKISLDLKECDLKTIVQISFEDLKIVHGDRFFIKAEETIKGFWDGTAIRRMIENLALNAAKYGSTNTPITLSFQQINDQVEIGIHNFGNPIPAVEQENIFQPFHRSEAAASGPQKGWGLGLTLVKGLAEAHGGKVFLKSSPEHGTTFSIIIPQHSRKN